MKLKQQVTNLELSKKLKELGVKQESLFYWFAMDDSSYEGIIKPNKEVEDIIKGADHYYSAFTVAELGELLPCILWRDRNENYQLHYWKTFDNRYVVTYRRPATVEDMFPLVFDDNNNTEADARAKILIYLYENKLIKNS